MEKTIHAIRRQNTRYLLEHSPLSRQDFLSKCNLKSSNLSNLLKDQNMGNMIARRIEHGLGKPEGWLDIEHNYENHNEEPLLDLFLECVTQLNAMLIMEERSINTIPPHSYRSILSHIINNSIQAGAINTTQIQSTLSLARLSI